MQNRRFLSIVITCVPCWALAYLATNIFQQYAFGLFIWLPLVLGFVTTIIFAYKNSAPKRKIRNNAFITLLFFCLGLLTFAFEGIICIAMAAPIGLFFTWVGYFLGYWAISSNANRKPHATVILLLLSVSSL